VKALHALPETALIDMGDFVGGMLKYVKTHPVPRVTIAGGVGKLTKLAQGLLDLHSQRGSVDLALLALAEQEGASARSPDAFSPPIPRQRRSLAEKTASLGDVVARAGRNSGCGCDRQTGRGSSCSTATEGWSAMRRSWRLMRRRP
jgi:cobalt-precorrin-5B (C1)-methyltransferase